MVPVTLLLFPLASPGLDVIPTQELEARRRRARPVPAAAGCCAGCLHAPIGSRVASNRDVFHCLYSLLHVIARGDPSEFSETSFRDSRLPSAHLHSRLTEERPAAGAQALLANGANRVATAGLAGFDALPIAQSDAAAPKLTRFPGAASAAFAATQIWSADVSNTVRGAAFTVGARLAGIACATLPPAAIRSTGVGAATRRADRIRWRRMRASSLLVPAFPGLDRGETPHGQQTGNQRAGGDADPASRPGVELLPVHDSGSCPSSPSGGRWSFRAVRGQVPVRSL